MIRRLHLIVFVCLYMSAVFAQEPAPLTDMEDEVAKMFDSIQASGRFVSALDSGSFYNMPVSIASSIADPQYAILIDQVKIMPTRAEFDASMILTNPFDGSKLVFRAERVPFSFSGGILGDFRLELVSEKPVSVCKDIDLEILSGSYVTCNCNGFKSLSIKGNIALSDEVFVRADEQGRALPGQAVKSFFEVTVSDWNNLAFTVSLPRFQLKAYSDFTFTAQNLSVDMSDLVNPSTLRFPPGYTALYPANMISLWRGIYIQDASILLNPEKFKRRNNPAPLVVGAHNLLIDENGFTGEVFAENLVSLDQGSLAGWNFSIEHLGLQFETSELAGGSLTGQIHVPVFDDETNFNYSAFVDVQGNYGFTAGVSNTLNFDLFGRAELDIYRNSYLQIQSDSNGFVPTLCLNGQMRMNAPIQPNDAPGPENAVAVPTIAFQDFKVTTVEPFIDIAYFGFASGAGQSKLSKFPLTISEIAFQSTSTQAQLSITANVNLKETASEGFGGSTTITLLADREGYRYHYRGARIDEIAINVEKPNAYKMYGLIGFARGDAIYGNGFKGELNATFGGNITVEATALFGMVNTTRYFFVDAAFALKPGLPAGPMTIFGFSGGLYYHMARLTTEYSSQYRFGQTQSGKVYTPNASSGIGIMAGVKLALGSEQTINGDLKFEIAFNNSGGINFIGFNGVVACITQPIDIDVNRFKAASQQLVEQNPNNIPPPEGSMLAARFNMYKDFVNNEFHAEMEMYVNVAGVLVGTGANNRAGRAVAHCGPDEWYLHIGTPQDPIGLSLIGLAQLRAYFMAGDRIPDDIPMNPRVLQILNLTQADLSGNRDNNMIANGSGLAFGASFDVSTGDQTFLIFYGRFDLGAGFDLMLKDNGPNAYCAGYAHPLGINGWYAKGQAYAYFSGVIGLKAKVFGKEKKFDILNIATAALLKAEGPNPVWLVGYVGGEYSVLGGMIKGNCNFKAEVGERCDMQGAASPLSNLQLIGDITPKDADDEVDVFTFPQVVFNVPVESTQKISGDDDQTIYFRIKLNEIKILDRNGAEYPSTYSWSDNRKILVLQPSTIFYPEQDYRIKVTIGFEELKNGVWSVFADGGQALTETKEVAFKTGDLPAEIPHHVIEASYPLDRMYNFYQDEYDYAYLKCLVDIAPYFQNTEESSYNRFARWETPGDAPIKKEYSYNAAEKTVYVAVPELKADRVYTLNFVASPKDKSGDVTRNVSSTATNTLSDTLTSSATIQTQSATGTITSATDKINYSIPFRVSRYRTLKSKVLSTMNVHYLYDVGFYKFYLVAGMGSQEIFDGYELNGTTLNMVADNESSTWYNDYIYPNLYKNYPLFGSKVIRWRDVEECGLPPANDIRIWQYPVGASIFITDLEIETGVSSTSTADFYNIAYTIPVYWSNDFIDIRTYASQQVLSNPNYIPHTSGQSIFDNYYLRAPAPSDFYIDMKYLLPGKNISSSEFKVKLKHTIKTDISDF